MQIGHFLTEIVYRAGTALFYREAALPWERMRLDVPWELDAICLKALEKKRQDVRGLEIEVEATSIAAQEVASCGDLLGHLAADLVQRMVFDEEHRIVNADGFLKQPFRVIRGAG